MTRKTKVGIFAVIIVAIIGFGIHIFGYEPIYLPDEEPISVTINIFSEMESEESPFSITSHDKSQIRQFVDILKIGRKNSDHKCGDIGTIAIQYKNSIETINFLPGHKPKYYELRYNGGNYRIKRDGFIQQLEKLSVPVEKITLLY